MRKIKVTFEITIDNTNNWIISESELTDEFDNDWKKFFQYVIQQDGLNELVSWKESFTLKQVVVSED